MNGIHIFEFEHLFEWKYGEIPRNRSEIILVRHNKGTVRKSHNGNHVT